MVERGSGDTATSTRYRCDFHVIRDAVQEEGYGVDHGDKVRARDARKGVDDLSTHHHAKNWSVALVTDNMQASPPVREESSKCSEPSLGVASRAEGMNLRGNLLIRGARKDSKQQSSKRAESQREGCRKSLPWHQFLPHTEQKMQRGIDIATAQTDAQGDDFTELLDEGKQRLQKGQKEERLRERAEMVGHTGDDALDDVLSDLHEPSFSRRQNERLRQLMADRLRAKISRLFGRVMCAYFSGSDSSTSERTHAEGNDMVRATATFRVKLQRLLDQNNLGEIQAQVVREISGSATGTATTPPRQRRCCQQSNVENRRKESLERRIEVEVTLRAGASDESIPVRPKTTGEIRGGKAQPRYPNESRRVSTGIPGGRKHRTIEGKMCISAGMKAVADMGSYRPLAHLAPGNKSSSTDRRKSSCRGGVAIDMAGQKLRGRGRNGDLKFDMAGMGGAGTGGSSLGLSAGNIAHATSICTNGERRHRSVVKSQRNTMRTFVVEGDEVNRHRVSEDDESVGESLRSHDPPDRIGEEEEEGFRSTESASDCNSFDSSSDSESRESNESSLGPFSPIDYDRAAGLVQHNTVSFVNKNQAGDGREMSTSRGIAPLTARRKYLCKVPQVDTGLSDGHSQRHRSGKKRKGSGRRRQDVRGTRDGMGGSCANVFGSRGRVFDEASSNHSLTVLLTELGLYKSPQRTALANHLPAELKDTNKAEKMKHTMMMMPSPRVDRPHFSPAFVELAGAGKGPTLLMCPEPVAPGYDYADVFTEVVKMHPPVGQLMLDEIARGNIVTRSDALAHVAYFEHGSSTDRSKLLVSEFLSDSEITAILASADNMKLDLAACVDAGTLFDNDVP